MKRIALLLTAVLALSSTVNGNTANTAQVQDAMVLGKLYFVNIEEGKQPIMTGLSLNGNRCGSKDFNSKPYAAEGIR